jgi:hypothetical protein
MYHVLAHTLNTYGVTNTDMTPIADDIFTISNGHFLPDRDVSLYGAYVSSANLQRSQIVTPKTRQVVPPIIYPIQTSLLPPTRPNWMDSRVQPFMLRAVEEIALQVTIGGAANERSYGLLFVGTGLDHVPSGDIYTIHGTSTTAAVASTWTSLAMTLDQTLPAGIYALISSQIQSTNAIAHRWIFKDQSFRPGFLSVTSLGNLTDRDWYRGGMGMLGKFSTVTYPIPQVLCNAADNAHDILISFVRIG